MEIGYIAVGSSNDLPPPSVIRGRRSVYQLNVAVKLVPVMSDLQSTLELFQWFDYTAGVIAHVCGTLVQLIKGYCDSCGDYCCHV